MGVPAIWIAAIGGGLSCCGLVTLLWQWWAARRFAFDRRRLPAGPMPGVTVIKPVRGSDAGTRGALETWLRLDYAGPVEVLFAVETEDVEAEALVRALLGGGGVDSPFGEAVDLRQGLDSSGTWSRRVQLVRCNEVLGANGKIAKVIRASKEAQYDWLVVSDADVAVPAELLREAVAPLSDGKVGLCCCLYRLAGAETAAMRWEAAAVNIDFWSQVLQARTLGPMDFGLGAVMALSRDWLQRSGGFEALADYLADDFQLGHRVHAAGGRIELCPVVVDCRDPQRGWGEVWRHQLRWARTIRVSRPAAYFASILSNALLGPLAWLAASGVMWWAGVSDSGWLCLAGVVALVALAALRVLVAMDLQRLFVGEPAWRVPWWMPLVKDVLALGLWVASFTGNRIEWRGLHYRVGTDGRLRAFRA